MNGSNDSWVQSDKSDNDDTGKNPGEAWCTENVNTWGSLGGPPGETNAWETPSEKCRSRSRYIIRALRERNGEVVILLRLSAKMARTQSAT